MNNLRFNYNYLKILKKNILKNLSSFKLIYIKIDINIFLKIIKNKLFDVNKRFYYNHYFIN